MATKTTAKLDLEITLEKVEIPVRSRIKESTHVLSARLLWPRVAIAKRTAETEVRLERGVCDLSNAHWYDRVLFRETVDGRFALALDLTVSLTRTQLRTWRRMTMGFIMKSAGELADNVGFAGELAEAPLKTMAKELQAAKDAELLATGAVDLDMAKFLECPEEGLLVEVPLVSALDITRVTRRHHPIPQVGTAWARIQKC